MSSEARSSTLTGSSHRSRRSAVAARACSIGSVRRDREARRADDLLEQGDWKRELKVADWDRRLALSMDALLTKTKDLQVGSWLAEGLTMLHGFAGARDGLKLMKGLHEQFWETCYPEIDEGDMEGRANVLSFFDARCPLASQGPADARAGDELLLARVSESRPFDYPETVAGRSQRRAVPPHRLKRQAAAENKTSGEDFRRRRPRRRRPTTRAPRRFSRSLGRVPGARRVMDEKFGRQTPVSSELKKATRGGRRVVDSILKEKRALEPDAAAGGGRGRSRGGGGTGRPVQSFYRVAGPSGLSGAGASARPARRGGGVLPPDRAAQPRLLSRPTRDSRGARCRSRPGLADVIKDTSVLEGSRRLSESTKTE